MRWILFITFLVISFCYGQDEGGDLDALIGQVFTNPNAQDGNKAGQPNLNPGSPNLSPGSPNLNPGSPNLNPGSPNLNPGSPNLNPGQTNLNPSQPGTGGDDCECVPYYLCTNGSINDNGEGLIDIRLKGDCESYLDVCCDPPNKVDKPITPPPDVNKLTGCGVRNPEGVGFRIKGDVDSESQFGEFPWMVAVLREEAVDGNAQKLNVYQCGGALIHPRVVITAAHCVADKTKHKFLKIRAGEWDTQTKNELLPHQDRDVEEVKIHEQYYAGALFNDIAFLLLRAPIDIADNVDVVCLPPQGHIVDGSRCFASGWGKNVFGQEGRYQVILKKVELPIVPRQPCVTALRKTRLGKHFELHRSFICAGGEAGKDTCKGDGGSPLVCPVPGTVNRYMQAGIVAWGIGCGENNTPGVYVNVGLFRDWIDEQMVYHQLDRASYSF